MAEERNEIVEVKESEATKREPVKYHTDFSLGIFGSSDNFMMATQMAKAFAGSTIVRENIRDVLRMAWWLSNWPPE